MLEELFVLGGCVSALWMSVRGLKNGGEQRDGLNALIGIWGAIVSGIFGLISFSALVRALL